MAKTPAGILGAFVGKAGSVTGYMRHGQNIIRTSRSDVRYKPTPLRTEQLEKVKLCSHFTKAFTRTGFFNKSFPAYGHTGSGYNRATSALMNQAVVGSYPDLRLSYPQVMVSRGKLPPADGAAAARLDDGNILFNFTDNSDTGTAAKNDRIILVAFAEALQQAIFSLHAGTRSDSEAVLQAGELKGYGVETWIGFLSSDEENASDSVYAGRVQL